MTSPSGIEAQVCEDIALRQQKGISKYGVTVSENPLELREWVQHAYEECLDMAVYLRRILAKLDEKDSKCTCSGVTGESVCPKCAKEFEKAFFKP